MSNLYSTLQTAVEKYAAIRLVIQLKPGNADGLVYPPTYDQGQHIFRPAWIDGGRREAVLLDSVQSQANRIETTILNAHRRREIIYPDIVLVVPTSGGEERYSVLELSHRVYDAALRSSTVDGLPFSKSPLGESIFSARREKATGLFLHAPIILALGGWDSHGGGGPLVAKIPRMLTSEIVGLDAQPVSTGAVKFDPMDIRKDAGPLYDSKDPERLYEIDKGKAKKGSKEKPPSQKGLGNVPSFIEKGAVITEAVQTSLISLSAARRLHFEVESGDYNEDHDHACRTAVVALALYGLLAQMESGYDLRSGCNLFPVQEPKMEIIGRTLDEVEYFSLSAADACNALKTALSRCEELGFKWRKETIYAQADERLITLVERSRKATGED